MRMNRCPHISNFYLDRVRIPMIPANEEGMHKWQGGMTRSNIL